MKLFVDTSALYAVLDADDARHEQARGAWLELLEREAQMICTNYILVETVALVQRRLGMEAARVLLRDVVPLLRVEWVSEVSHEAGVAAFLAAGDRGLSLVDCASFETMRRLGLDTAFAFDRHFEEQGFRCVPQQ